MNKVETSHVGEITVLFIVKIKILYINGVRVPRMDKMKVSHIDALTHPHMNKIHQIITVYLVLCRASLTFSTVPLSILQ